MMGFCQSDSGFSFHRSEKLSALPLPYRDSVCHPDKRYSLLFNIKKQNQMKRFFTICVVLAAMFLSGCSKYDDSALWNSVNDLDDRLAALEKTVARMNGDIESINSIVSTLEGGGMITDVKETAAGYEITVSGRTAPIVIRHGSKGEDGDDGLKGEDGKDAPVIGVRQDDDGKYYWTVTVDGQTTWLPDEENRLPVTGADGKPGDKGMTPIMGVDSEGYWTVDYGTGAERLPGDIKAAGSEGDSFFERVDESGEDHVIIVLRSGAELVIPRNNATLVFTAPEDGLPVDVHYGANVTLSVSLNKMQYAEVLAVPAGWHGSMNFEDATVTVTAPVRWSSEVATEGKVSIIGLAENGQTMIAVQDIYVVDYTHPDGTFVVTEGNMSNQNGTLHYFDQYMKEHSYIYENANDGRSPGNVLQDMWIAGDRTVLLCQNGGRNGGDGQVVVCDAHTMKADKIYNGLVFDRPAGSGNVGCPQHLAVVGDKAFIQFVDAAFESNSGIRVFDLSTGTLAGDDVEGTYGTFAQNGALKGRMWVSRGVVVAALANAVVFIDPLTEGIVNSIDFTGQVKGIVKGADGNFHVAVSGDFEGAPNAVAAPDGAKIVGIDHEANILYTYDLPEGVKFPVATYQPSVSMGASFTQPHIYLVTGTSFSNTKADRFDYQTRTFTPAVVSFPGYDAIYGYMGVHPVTGRLFVGQSVAYSTTRINLFDPEATADPVAVYDYTEASPAGVDFAYRFSEEFINR